MKITLEGDGLWLAHTISKEQTEKVLRIILNLGETEPPKVIEEKPIPAGTYICTRVNDAPGAKIRAIKMFRILWNLGLKEAKDFVEGISPKNPFVWIPTRETALYCTGAESLVVKEGWNELRWNLNFPDYPKMNPTYYCVGVRPQKKIYAIKAVRILFDMNLAEGKAFVEGISKSNPLIFRPDLARCDGSREDQEWLEENWSGIFDWTEPGFPCYIVECPCPEVWKD